MVDGLGDPDLDFDSGEGIRGARRSEGSGLLSESLGDFQAAPEVGFLRPDEFPFEFSNESCVLDH